MRTMIRLMIVLLGAAVLVGCSEPSQPPSNPPPAGGGDRPAPTPEPPGPSR